MVVLICFGVGLILTLIYFGVIKLVDKGFDAHDHKEVRKWNAENSKKVENLADRFKDN